MLEEKTAIHITSKQIYNKLMKEFEKQGIKWENGDKATEFKGWVNFENRCIAIHNGRLGWSYLQNYIKKGYKIIKFEENDKKS